VELRWQVLGDDRSEGDADALAQGLLWRGSKTLVVSQPKAGKSFLAVALAAALLNGDEFLGRPTEPSRVLYLTEETTDTFERKLREFGLGDGDDRLKFLRRAAESSLEWPEIVDSVSIASNALEADVVVVDVLHRWAGFGPDDENKSGVVSEAIGHLDKLTEHGTSVLILHHSGWNSRRARGSTDIHGAVDDIFHLERSEDGYRHLEFLGGRHESDEKVAYKAEWQAAGEGLPRHRRLVSMGNQSANQASKTDQVIEVLSLEPMTTKEVADETGMSERSALRWLSRAHRFGLIARESRDYGNFTWRKLRRFELAEDADRV
jgi:hypothetical protein